MSRYFLTTVRAGGQLGVKHSPAKRTQPSRGKLSAALHEVFTDEPSTVTRANVSGERKHKMKIAIAYSKARKEK